LQVWITLKVKNCERLWSIDMWTLWIVSSVIGSAEPKYTRYDEYEHWYECQDAWQELSSAFTENEIAFCEATSE